MTLSLWWIRRDVRLHDNQALEAARQRGDVLPVYVLDPAVLEARWNSRAENRRAFLFAALRNLDASLRARGSRLVVRVGRPEAVLAEILRQTGANTIWAEEDYSPYARQRDARLRQALPLHLTGGLTVHPPGAVAKKDGGPYTVFTPFSKAWKALPLPHPRDVLSAPPVLAPVPGAVTGHDWPNEPAPPAFPANEDEAQRRLDAFTQRALFSYHDGRNFLDREGTSGLSPYLRFGLISARTCAARALAGMAAAPHTDARKSAEHWLNELIWREFYQAILYHFPHVLKTAFNANLRDIGWREAPDDLAAWRAGQTGYPIVDAAMRQLNELGWMHNRARMIVASFLCKDLLINWQLGEQYFMHRLVDGDPASNNGGWQWTAGVGTDAAPYFRIFNPVLQGEKFDPSGDYIRRYVPELAGLPTKALNQPWLLSPLEQAHYGVVLGRDYPERIVDREIVKARTLAAYKSASG
jgi:deoxyribodipyrimidine photo-lyase